VFLKILLKRETLRAIFALECFDSRMRIQVSLKGKLGTVFFSASLGSAHEFFRSSSSWHFYYLLYK